MRTNRKSLFIMMTALLFVAMTIAPVVYAADQMQITGRVTTDGTLESDNGQVYTINNANDKGKELIDNNDKRVSVMGAVTEQGGQYTITVDSFKVLETNE